MSGLCREEGRVVKASFKLISSVNSVFCKICCYSLCVTDFCKLHGQNE